MSQQKPQNEEWRDVIGYEGLYQVSNFGRVRSLHKRGGGCLVKAKGGIIKPYVVRGYATVSLRKEGSYKHFQLHRIVATAFIPNPNELPQVNHIDEVKTNNHVNNLEWCTRSYNINYGSRNSKMAKQFSKAISQYSLDGILIETFASIAEASRRTGIQRSHICNVCKGKRNHTGGFKWKYM